MLINLLCIFSITSARGSRIRSRPDPWIRARHIFRVFTFGFFLRFFEFLWIFFANSDDQISILTARAGTLTSFSEKKSIFSGPGPSFKSIAAGYAVTRSEGGNPSAEKVF